MRYAFIILPFAALAVGASSPPPEQDEKVLAKCLWEKAPNEAEVIITTADQWAFMQALAKGGTACGQSQAAVDIFRFRKILTDAKPAAVTKRQSN